MKFKDSPYYNKEFLGKNLYNLISDMNKIFTIQEYFGINEIQKEYHVKNIYKNYKLKVFDNYYELDCQDYEFDLYLVFDKPVYITGKYCRKIIAPDIIIKSNRNSLLSCCVTNKVTIDNKYMGHYEISHSKVKDVYFYNYKITFLNSEINNFYIKNENIEFDNRSRFIDNHKIKVFGKCKNLKEEMLNSLKFREGIIHIE